MVPQENRRRSWLAIGLLLALRVTGQSPGVVDVMQFGAKGDGQADDTAAIQRAADAAAQRTVAFQPQGSAYLGAAPPVYFPAGRYRLTGEVTFGAYANLLSDARAIVEQTGDCRTFVFPGGYTVTVTGIRFLGGTHAIHFSNANVDTTTLYIDGCEFQLCKDYAIYTLGTTDGHLSASLVISRSKFFMPNRVLHNVCDSAVLRDCWATIGGRNFTPDSAAFMNRSGTLVLENLLGVPVFPLSAESPDQSRARWVDNYDQFIATYSRFGGEEAGIPIVFHFGKPGSEYPWMGQTIAIENSQISAGNSANPNAGVVTLRGGVPQLIRIVGNRYLVDSPYIRADGIDLDTYFGSVPRAADRFRITVEPNLALPRAPAVPKQLQGYLR